MRALLRIFLLLVVVLAPGCAQRNKRPDVYRGGQYYGDALHAQDLKNK